MKKIILLTVVLVLTCFSVIGQSSATHWFPPVGNRSGFVEEARQIRENQIWVTTESTTPVTVSFYQGSSVAPNFTRNVVAGAPVSVNMANGVPSPLVADNMGAVLNNEGFRIEATGLVSVSYRFRDSGGAQAALVTSKGGSARGKTFRAGGIPLRFGGSSTGVQDASFFSFMATEDNTTVTLTNWPVGVSFQNINGGNPLPAGFNLSVDLDKGESYVVGYVLGQDITVESAKIIGVRLDATNDIVVNTGRQEGTVTDVFNGWDYGMDQTVPVDRVGTEYVVSRAVGGDAVEVPVIIAHTNNTSVFVNGGTEPVATLKAGEFFRLDGGSDDDNTTYYDPVYENMYIRTTNPAYLFQNINGATLAEEGSYPQQGMFFVPPFICAAPRSATIPNSDSIIGLGVSSGLNIVTTSLGELSINGTPLVDLLANGTVENYGTNNVNGNYINGSANYVSYKLTGAALTGDLFVECTEDLYLAAYGFSGVVGYGGYFSGFAPEIVLNVDPAECLPQVLDAGSGFDEYKWFKNNVQILGATESTYRITETGSYYVQGIFTDCITVQSNTVVVDAVEAPTTTKPVASFCVEDNRTLVDLEADFDDFTAAQNAAFSTIVWYPYQIDDNHPTVVAADRLPKSTILEGGKTYYAAILEHETSTTGTELCESVNRLAVEVIIDAIPPIPSADSYEQSFCGVPSPTVGDLKATPSTKTDGSNYPLAWYDSKAGGTRLSSFTPLTDGAKYYVENYDPDLFCANTNRDSVLVDLNGPITVVKAIENKLACVGGTVTFEPVFNLTYPGEVTYKWEQKLVGETVWAAVPTTTDSDKLTYTTPALTAADHGKLIRVTASVVGCANTALSFARISVEGPVVINTQPSDVTGCVGGSASFSVDASAAQGTLSYQWYRKIEPVPPATDPTWVRVGTNDASYTLSPLAISQHESVFRVDVRTGACAYVKSNEVTLKVEGPLDFVNTLPTTTAVCATNDAVFEVLASGDNIAAGDIVYTWEESLNDGVSWTALDDAMLYDGQPFTNTFTLTNGDKTLTKLGVTNADNGRRYRASVKSGACNGLSTTSTTLKVEGAITITTHPADLTTCVGETERFAVVAESANTDDVLQYQWYESVDNDKPKTDPGLVWSPLAGDAIHIKSAIPAAASGNHYKVQIFTDACSFVESDIMTLTVEGPIAIISPPTMTTVCAGGDAMFITTANAGEGVPKFKWESFNTMTNAWEVEKEDAPATGETRSTITDTLKLTGVAADYNQKLIRVSVTSTECTRPQEATTTLNVEGPVVITSHPTDVTVCAGTTAEFDVTASGEGTLLYQWYRREKATDPWTSIGSRTATSKLSIDNVPVTLNGFQYSVGVTTAACTTEALSNPATLTTEGVVEIVTPLEDVQICDGGKTSFTVTATKGTTGTLAYQWEVSTDGGVNYNNIDMASTAPTYTLKDMNRTLELDGVTKDHSGYRYRVGVTTGKCTTPALSVATLTVDGPLVVAAPVAYSVCAGGTATFDTSVTGAGTYMYQWYRYPFNTTTGLLETTAVPIGSLSSNSKLTIDNVSPGFHKSQFYVGVTTVGCTVETKSANAVLTVEGPIEIANPLANQTVCEGEDATFEVLATSGSSGTLTYVWEESTDSGVSWSTTPLANLASTATTKGYTIAGNKLTVTNVQSTDNTYRYRVKVTTGDCKEAVISVGRLTVEGPIEITTDPTDVTVCSGDSATLSVIATGEGTLMYQWYRRQNSTAAWTTIGSRSTTPDLSLDNINSNLNKFQFRVGVTTGTCEEVFSNEATLTVEGPIIITSRFSDQLACPSEDVSYTVLASSGTAGQGTLIYKWEEYNPATMTWSEVTDAYAAANRIEFKRQDPTDMTSAKITLVKKAIVTSDDGNRYRVSLTTGACTFAEVVEAGLSVTGAITITTQPVDVATCVDTRVEFLVAGTSATGSNVSYQWEEKLKDETDWNDIGGATSARFVISPTQAYMDGAQYRAKLNTGVCTEVVSDPATLTVEGPITITRELENAISCVGGDVTYTVLVTNDASGTINYMWEESVDGGFNWSTIAGETTNTYTKLGVTANDSENRYRVTASLDACTSTLSSIATLKVEGPLVIVDDIVDAEVCVGDTAFFSPTLQDSPTTEFQYIWESSTDGGSTWTVISRLAAISVNNAQLEDNGTLYRVRIYSAGCTEIVSNTAMLFVQSLASIYEDPEDLEVKAGEDAMFMVTLESEFGDYTYQWQVNDTSDSGWVNLSDNGVYSGTTERVLSITGVSLSMDENKYRVLVTSCNGTVISDHALLTINNDIFPNYFSPNGDGINDTFVVPYLRDYPNFTMKIYDRWGNYLYEVADDGDVTTEPDWWNGISDGQLNYQDGELLPAGTYFYIIHYDLEDKKAPKTGWVYLRR